MHGFLHWVNVLDNLFEDHLNQLYEIYILHIQMGTLVADIEVTFVDQLLV